MKYPSMRVLSAASLLLTAAAVVACRSNPPLHVVVDPSLARGDAYEVSGFTSRHWGEPLRFGGFTTRKTSAGATWTWSAAAFDFGGGVRTQPYRFVFVGEQGEEWQVECRAKTPILRHTYENGSVELPVGETRLSCALRDPSSAVHTLTLAGDAVDFRGVAAVGDPPLEIRPLHDVPDSAGDAHRIPGVLGYELRQGDRVLGSVDLLGRGRVYLASGLPSELRTATAMTAAVLLLFGNA